MTTTPEITASDVALAELRALLTDTPRYTTTITQDVNALQHRLADTLDDLHLTIRQRAVEMARQMLTDQQYAIVEREGRVAFRDGLPDGTLTCAAHLRGDCHDSSICPICQAEQSGITLGKRMATDAIACG